MLTFFGIFAVLLSISWIYSNSVLDPVLWNNPFPLPAMSDAWAVNNILSSAKHVAFAGLGPESLTVNPRDGVVYTGVSDGRVISFDKDGNYLHDIFFVGGKNMNLFQVVV
jgi:hypothetical protein